MKKLLICVIAASFSFTNAIAEEKHAEKDAQHPHWSYEGKTDPSHWGELQSEFAACSIGKEQSPVDIRNVKKQELLPAIVFNYVANSAEVVNNGHTIQVNLQSGSTVKLASGEYKLVQFHFHAPSEEKIEGKNYPLVGHFVHRADDGKLAVVAVLFKEGKSNPALARIFDVMPAEVDAKAALGADFSPADLLPGNQSYYSFMGSLTTPPCSEGVQWQVLKTPVELSDAQLKIFKKLYRNNARPVQPLNGRVIREG
ncbi:MAG: carbonic anhydrase family protein [Azoarcus sp.]|jgi:carbonic anhydrase|nr:carbonic anhydrase family protein [Azoarcus sp.]